MPVSFETDVTQLRNHCAQLTVGAGKNMGGFNRTQDDLADRMACLESEKDDALLTLEDLSAARSLIVLLGTEAQVEDHAKTQALQRARYDHVLAELLELQRDLRSRMPRATLPKWPDECAIERYDRR